MVSKSPGTGYKVPLVVELGVVVLEIDGDSLVSILDDSISPSRAWFSSFWPELSEFDDITLVERELGFGPLTTVVES